MVDNGEQWFAFASWERIFKILKKCDVDIGGRPSAWCSIVFGIVSGADGELQTKG